MNLANPLESGLIVWNFSCQYRVRTTACCDWRSAMAETREEWIKKRAYALWEEEGHPTGRDSFHWDQARTEHDALKEASKSPNGKNVKPKAKKAAAPKAETPGPKAEVPAAKVEAANSSEAKKPAKRAAATTKANGVVKSAPKRAVVRKPAS
jgi:Protein of unknown function (DUF2934)